MVAERKIRLLLRTGVAVTVVAPDITDELQRLQGLGELSHLEGFYDKGQLIGQWLVVAATGSETIFPYENQRVSDPLDPLARSFLVDW